MVRDIIQLRFLSKLSELIENRGVSLAYRVALWHPDLVSHVFTLCVPYSSPQKRHLALEDFVATIAPHFAYQLQFRDGELEHAIKSEEDIKQFLLAMYGGKTKDRKFGFDTSKGILLENMPQLQRSRLFSEKVDIPVPSILESSSISSD